MHEDYRRAAADLAYAQTHFPASETTTYLNRLVAQAHGELYGAAPRRAAKLWRFWSRDYPRLIRGHSRQMLISAGLILGAVSLGFLLVHVDYPLARLFLPEQLRDGVGDTLERGSTADELSSAIAPLLSAGITINNIQVSLMAFAGGMTAGALTVYALLMNGLLLGALAGVYTKANASLMFWSLIVPHGALELPAIVIAGGAGLMLARALLFPRDLPRGEALRLVSGDAARVVLGTIPLFVVAGLVEGFFTPRGVEPVLKLAVGGLLFVLLVMYLGFAGRGAAE